MDSYGYPTESTLLGALAVVPQQYKRDTFAERVQRNKKHVISCSHFKRKLYLYVCMCMCVGTFGPIPLQPQCYLLNSSRGKLFKSEIISIYAWIIANMNSKFVQSQADPFAFELGFR